MESSWDDSEAAACADDPLRLRVYTSRLLGREPSLALHGGGNTSVKSKVTNFFGDSEEVLYVKGSGWDLATIEAPGFAPVKLDALLRLAELEQLSDSEMVRLQRAAMIEPNAPNPSVEAILHAIIPFAYVDHTHADAVVAITNTDAGEQRIREVYGARVLVVPYVMPGFILARQVYEMTRGVDWNQLDGLVLMNHGVVSFGEDAQTSYERMIDLVTTAEAYLRRHGAWQAVVTAEQEAPAPPPQRLARVRRAVCAARGVSVVARFDENEATRGFASRPSAVPTATRGPLTLDHLTRTKRIPLVIGDDPADDVARYTLDYHAYFDRHTDGQLTCLDPAPRWAVWPGYGTVAFGATAKEANIITDIVRHTVRAIQWGEALGGWEPLPEAAQFKVEYWAPQQAKLRTGSAAPPLQGRIALVTGAASGIGRACAEALRHQGAAVAGLDINPDVARLLDRDDSLGLACDVTDAAALHDAVEAVITRFGGLDILISNAGTFPPTRTIEEMDDEVWSRSLDINLSSHQRLLRACIPYLVLGVDPTVVIIGSKNVPAPGPGAAAYSVPKAGLTQLARVAALELAGKGVRVNVIHPNAVFDTGVWTDEVLASRAASYGMSVEEYKSNNLLQVEVTAQDVAALACAMVGPAFAKTTGAQIPIDGGNERVI